MKRGMLIGVLAVAAATVWIGGEEAIAYTVGFLAVALVNLAVFNRHASTQHAVLIPSASDIRAPAHALSWGWQYVAVFVVVLAGFVAVTVALTKRSQHRDR